MSSALIIKAAKEVALLIAFMGVYALFVTFFISYLDFLYKYVNMWGTVAIGLTTLAVIPGIYFAVRKAREPNS